VIDRRLGCDTIHQKRNKETHMKRYLMMLAAFTVLSTLAWAQEGAATYKAKCAMCHGPEGQGKIGPSLQKSVLSQKQIEDLLLNGQANKKAPHNKKFAGLSAGQASAVAGYVASLKK
jgi:mono/diheme cytochrome c family protein